MHALPETQPSALPRLAQISPELAGARLDRALAALASDLSRSRLQALVAAGHVMLVEPDGLAGSLTGQAITDNSRKVQAGETYAIHIPEAVPALPQGENIPLAIVFEDEDMLVIDKPAGLTVHPAPGNREHTLVNALIAHCGGSLSGIGGILRPGIVHRLDKETSGLMVAAKNDLAHHALSRQLADRSLSRVYQAVVWGMPPREGTVDAPLGRSGADRKKMAVREGGKSAQTDFTVLKSLGPNASLVECRLRTGRTHQIRVHMQHIGHPVVGDPLYGKRVGAALRRDEPFAASFPRQALHAAAIAFIHPRTHIRHEFAISMPQDMIDLVQHLTLPHPA